MERKHQRERALVYPACARQPGVLQVLTRRFHRPRGRTAVTLSLRSGSDIDKTGPRASLPTAPKPLAIYLTPITELAKDKPMLDE